MKFSFVEDIKEYTIENTQKCKKVILAGLTVIALTVGSADSYIRAEFKYQIPTSNYELVETSHRFVDVSNYSEPTVDLKITENINIISLNAVDGVENMSAEEKGLVNQIISKLSVLPINVSFAQFNEKNSAYYMSISLPHYLRISMTRYLKGDDENIYFSVKGNGELLYTGMMPIDEMVDKTLRSLESLNLQS